MVIHNSHVCFQNCFSSVSDNLIVTCFISDLFRFNLSVVCFLILLQFHFPQLCWLELFLLNILSVLFCLSSPLGESVRFILLWRMVSLLSLKLFSLCLQKILLFRLDYRDLPSVLQCFLVFGLLSFFFFFFVVIVFLGSVVYV